MSDSISVKDLYNNVMKDIKQKFYNIPDDENILKITPLFNDIECKRKQMEKLTLFIQQTDNILNMKIVPKYVKTILISAKHKLIDVLTKTNKHLTTIEKEECIKQIIVKNMFMLEHKDYETTEEENIEENTIEKLSLQFNDLQYWIKFEQWDYVEDIARKINQEEIKQPFIQIPSAIELYYTYCIIS